MSVASESLADITAEVLADGQWIAIGRYTGTGPARVRADTLARAYVRFYDSSELIGSIAQGDQTAIALVDTLSGILPVTTNDKLITGFDGFDIADVTPTLVGGRVVNGKETAIKNPMKRTPGGVLIAIEIHATG